MTVVAAYQFWGARRFRAGMADQMDHLVIAPYWSTVLRVPQVDGRVAEIRLMTEHA